MITWSIDAYSKKNEDLLFEIEIPESKVPEVAEIMEWNEDDKAEFLLGIGVFSINQDQALLLEQLLGKKFYSAGVTLQLSGGCL